MSFRTAYSSLKSGKKPSKPQGYLRDPTPEEWKKTMDEYHKRQTNNQYPSSWSRWG
jgi:hypothetical protein